MISLELRPIMRSYEEYSRGADDYAMPHVISASPVVISSSTADSDITSSSGAVARVSSSNSSSSSINAEVLSKLSRTVMRTTSDQFQNNKYANRCSECRTYCLSNNLLELHVAETHDSYFTCLAARKPSYKCIVAGWFLTCHLLNSNV
jgi:hypothetical protein